MVAGAEYLPVERHDLVHVAHELRVELTLQGDRHGSQHARMDVDGSRPHQQTRLGIELAEQLGAGAASAAGCLLLRDASKTITPSWRDAGGSAGGLAHWAGLAKAQVLCRNQPLCRPRGLFCGSATKKKGASAGVREAP
jgi:hypothetical protein